MADFILSKAPYMLGIAIIAETPFWEIVLTTATGLNLGIACTVKPSMVVISTLTVRPKT